MVTARKSFCRLCIGSCGMIIELDKDRRLLSVRGDPDHPATMGYAFQTGLQGPEIRNSPQRLLKPLKRMPDHSLQEISIEQALDEIAERLKVIIARHGPDAVAAFKGTAWYANTLAAPMMNAWLKAMGSSSIYTTMTVDQSAKFVAAERQGVWGAGSD